MKLKIKSGTKLKDAPVEYRVALRLVTLGEQRQKEANVNQLAKDVGAQVPEVMQAIQLLTKDNHIEVTLFTPATMILKFRVANETRTALVKDASSYNRHILALVERAARPKGPGLPPPIDPAVRTSFTHAARPLADRLLANDHEHVTWQIAGCIARIGQEKVEALVEAVIAQHPPVEKGALKTFFDLYVAKRDEGRS